MKPEFGFKQPERATRDLKLDVVEAVLTSYPTEGWRAGVMWPDGKCEFGAVKGWTLPTADTPLGRVRRLRRKYVPIIELDDGRTIEGCGCIVYLERRLRTWLENGRHK